MDEKTNNKLSNVLFIPHGGGPLPLLGDNSHQEMVAFLKRITPTLGKPSAILIISAHWEEKEATITSGKAPSLIYDYSGFPDESYNIQYPALGSPELAEKIYNLLWDSGIEARLDDKRGFDHGVFVPLTIMFPEANIPCVQLSLLSNLEPKAHIQMGKALAGLRSDNVLVIGSGLSFHNMREFFQASGYPDEKNEAFERWLIDTCTDKQMTTCNRDQKLETWANAPFARYCHPREEHLLPLHVCNGFSNSAAELVFDGNVIGKKASAFLW
ncbi:MAG: class III extradiol ring-cleavage dioxygenase [Cycloclasticus sp.]